MQLIDKLEVEQSLRGPIILDKMLKKGTNPTMNLVQQLDPEELYTDKKSLRSPVIKSKSRQVFMSKMMKSEGGVTPGRRTKYERLL